MDTNRGRVLFVMVDSAGKYGDMYRQLFPDLRNATFFVSQSGEPHCCPPLIAWLSAWSRKTVALRYCFSDTISLSSLDGGIREACWSAVS